MTKIYAHRGSSGTHPENTMAAFKEAKRVGADGIELDVHYTKDDELVVIHDNTVDRTTNEKGPVRSYNLSELIELDAGKSFSRKFKGEKVPSFVEVLDWIQSTDLLLNIELKYVAIDYVDFEEKVLAELEKRDLINRVVISSFNHDGLKKIKRLNPNIETGILYMERLYEPWNYAKTVNANAIHPLVDGVDPDLIARSEKNACPVRVFTVNDDKMLSGLMQIGSSAIITDYPERAIAIRESLQQK